jgi:HD-GYP domain-containing protein (c-di-GMP phosphodiesterase class II)
MRTIPRGELRENLYFDAPVYLDSGYILLSPDVHVGADLLARLERWGFENVYCDGKPVESPAYLATGKTAAAQTLLELDVKEKQQMEAARKVYYGLINFTVEAFGRFSAANRLDLASITERIKTLMEALKSSRDTILRLPEFDYLYQHSVNSTILALALGDCLRLPPHRLIELGIGTLLHDIGMLKIPENIYMATRPLQPREWQMIKAHPMLSYRILKGFSVSDTIALTAYEHHERMNGSGYPRALAGEKITLYSRILGVADTYDAITTRRPFKDKRDGHSALAELLKGRGTLYDETAIRALIYSLSVYPLGSPVLLSDGAIARVIRTNPRSPKSPIVQILIDREGNHVAELAVATTSEEGSAEAPAIRRSLSWKEIEAHNLQ